jgi:hypothetical protein
MGLLGERLGDVTVGQAAGVGLAYKFRKPLAVAGVVTVLGATVAAAATIFSIKDSWENRFGEIARKDQGPIIAAVLAGVFALFIVLTVVSGLLFGRPAETDNSVIQQQASVVVVSPEMKEAKEVSKNLLIKISIIIALVTISLSYVVYKLSGLDVMQVFWYIVLPVLFLSLVGGLVYGVSLLLK